MIREKWNEHWNIIRPGENPMITAMIGEAGKAQYITLPHDAMIHEKRTETTRNKHQTGFYPGGCYSYIKKFMVPEEWKDKMVSVEFEGVYKNARVFVNGDYAGACPNGYTEFTVNMDDYLKYGQENEIKVIANNTEESSRWYSGSGIYRNVNLFVAYPIHIRQNSVRILTKEIHEDCATVQINIDVENTGRGNHKLELYFEILNSEGEIVSHEKVIMTVYGNDNEHARENIVIDNPLLWDDEAPNLYTCHVKVSEGDKTLDEATEIFGIRTITWNAKKGLCINGKTKKLRGSCIHHDNGVIGAVTLEMAEERRCRQLKEAGFNAIRSSHHPMSRAMLEACDKYGMFVMDELGDCWNRSKDNNDYAEKFNDYWKQDVEAMIAKDYNHPCVVIYSAGNEILEAGTAKGAQLNRQITDKFHEMDDSRPVTVAVNALLTCMDRIGEIISQAMGIPMEALANMQTEQNEDEKKSTAGSDEANSASDFLRGPMADMFSTSPIVTETLDEFVSVSDIAGFNYLTARHTLENQLHPNHMVIGTETLPSDIARLWKIVEDNPHVIGDMSWTGYDYIGEAGANFFYYDGRNGFMSNWPISLSCMGDIEITGTRKPISYYREIVYGLRKAPYIGVEDPAHYGVVPNHSAWGLKDDVASWTWHGYEGKPIVVNVYTNAEEVELFLNGESLGKKTVEGEVAYLTTFDITYQAGTLEAVAFRNGQRAECFALMTAEQEVELQLNVENNELKANGADLSYITVSLVDRNGISNLQAIKSVTVELEGQGTLQGVGSADPETLSSYDDTTWNTYHGNLLAVVRAGNEPGNIKVTFKADNCETKEVILQVK